jgi:putative NADH-flavin reductase
MKIAILGATGTVGRRLVQEALERGHEVTALARAAGGLDSRPGLSLRQVDFRCAPELEAAIFGHAALISAIGPAPGEPAHIVVESARAVAAACMRTGVGRVLVVGGAGSLNAEPGLELWRTPDFPAEWREIALAHREALQLWLKVKELDFTVLSPAAQMHPGTRTGRYRIAHNDLLRDASGQSSISTEDFAAAVLDELERGAHIGERITCAY